MKIKYYRTGSFNDQTESKNFSSERFGWFKTERAALKDKLKDLRWRVKDNERRIRALAKRLDKLK